MGRLGIDRLGLERFLDRVQEEFPLRAALVFGSRARGDELVDSDYDLILVSPAFVGMPFTRRAAALLHFWELPEGVDLFCYTPEEFGRKRRELSMVAEAVAEGLLLRGAGAAAPSASTTGAA